MIPQNFDEISTSYPFLKVSFWKALIFTPSNECYILATLLITQSIFLSSEQLFKYYWFWHKPKPTPLREEELYSPFEINLWIWSIFFRGMEISEKKTNMVTLFAKQKPQITTTTQACLRIYINAPLAHWKWRLNDKYITIY